MKMVSRMGKILVDLPGLEVELGCVGGRVHDGV